VPRILRLSEITLSAGVDLHASANFDEATADPAGSHSFMMPEAVVKGDLQPLRNPADQLD